LGAATSDDLHSIAEDRSTRLEGCQPRIHQLHPIISQDLPLTGHEDVSCVEIFPTDRAVSLSTSRLERQKEIKGRVEGLDVWMIALVDSGSELFVGLETSEYWLNGPLSLFPYGSFGNQWEGDSSVGCGMVG
jgi:hypothetical protein